VCNSDPRVFNGTALRDTLKRSTEGSGKLFKELTIMFMKLSSWLWSFPGEMIRNWNYRDVVGLSKWRKRTNCGIAEYAVEVFRHLEPG